MAPLTDLPPELQVLAALLDAQPGHVQAVFQYCLALLMVEGGKASLIATTPGESGAICTFQTVASDVFSLNKPPLSAEDEAAVREVLRQILDEEGGL